MGTKVNAYGSPWSRGPDSMPKIGRRVCEAGSNDVLIVIKTEPFAVAMTDTLGAE